MNQTWKCAPPSPIDRGGPGRRRRASGWPVPRERRQPEVSRGFSGRSEKIHVLAACQPDRPRQAATDRWMERPEVVRPDRGGRLARADPARLATRLTTTGGLGDDPFARCAGDQGPSYGNAISVPPRMAGSIGHRWPARRKPNLVVPERDFDVHKSCIEEPAAERRGIDRDADVAAVEVPEAGAVE